MIIKKIARRKPFIINKKKICKLNGLAEAVGPTV